jgi:UDP-N-acetylmuramoyl-tripeptide--D-alanyl-D-alanine ligase
MIAHVLQGRWQGLASEKSFNNEIGVPLTLLATDTHHRFVICEIGTNAPGEIARLARMVEPDIAVVVGVSEAHLEGLGTLRDVAEEKLSLFKFLRSDGCAVINGDQDLLAGAIRSDYDLRNLKYVRFGQSADADLRLTDTRVTSSGKRPPGIAFTVNGRFHYRLNVPGRHNVINAMAAIAVARRFNMDHDEIAARLATFELPPMRLQRECVGGVTLINDAYNANPASLAAAVDVLAGEATQGRRVLIVGDMRELGAESERLHRLAAENIGRSPIDVVISVGQRARLIATTIREVSGGRIETHAYASTPLARRRITQYIRIGDTIALKGSRLLGLETIARRIRDWLQEEKEITRKAAAKKLAPRKKKSPRVTL